MTSIGSGPRGVQPQQPIDTPAEEELKTEDQALDGVQGGRGVEDAGDNFTPGDPNTQNDSSDPDRTPGIPEVRGEKLSAESLQGRSAWLGESGVADLMTLQFTVMANMSIQDKQTARELKNSLFDSKIQLKDQQIGELETQHESGRDAANEAVVTAVVVAVATAVLTAAAGDTAADAIKPFTQVITPVSQSISKHVGAERKVTDSKEQQKRLEREEAVVDDAIESAKDNYKSADEQLKLALRIMQEVAERQTQVIQKFTS